MSTADPAAIRPADVAPRAAPAPSDRRAGLVTLVVVGGVVAALLLAVWLLTGVGPASTVRTFVSGAFGGWSATAGTVNRAIPLTIVGVGAAVALRGGVFNVGGEGQMAAGALAGAAVVTAVGATLPAPLTWAVALLAGLAGGAAWAAVPVALAARRGVSEILSTLLLNFVGASLLLWVLELGAFADPNPNVITPQGKPIPVRAELPVLESGSRLHLGVLVAVAVVAVGAWFLRTTRGLRVDLTGANPTLAAQAGVRPARLRATLLFTSAAAAGLAGAVQLLGVTHRVTTGLAGGIGYTGVLVAVLGRSRPLAVAGAAVAFGSVLTGGAELEFADVPRSVVVFAQAAAVVAAAAFGRTRRS